MQGQSFFQLISPLIFLVFSVGFAVLWHYARDVRALRFFALSYFLGACAFVGDFLRPLMSPVVEIYATSPFYISMALFFCGATFLFYRGRAPWKALWLTGAAMLALVSWYRFGKDDIVARTVVMHAGVFAMMVYTAFSLHRDMTRRIDRVLQAIIVMSAIQLVCRGAFIVFFEGSSLTQANYPNSLLALLVHFSVSIVALALAFSLFVIFSMEIVTRLTRTSETDPLTGVLNRRGFDSRIAALYEGPSGVDHCHAVVMADIDHFKSVNDRHGHDVGDAILSRFARILEGAARDGDFVVRWGGEEFMIVITNSDAASGRLYAETVRAVFESQSHDRLGGDSVTASFGIAEWRQGQTVSEVSRLADMALYRAKREGRNRVCIHRPGVHGHGGEWAVA